METNSQFKHSGFLPFVAMSRKYLPTRSPKEDRGRDRDQGRYSEQREQGDRHRDNLRREQEDRAHKDKYDRRDASRRLRKATTGIPPHLREKTAVGILSRHQHQSHILHPSIRTANRPRTVNTITDPGAAATAGTCPDRATEHHPNAASEKPRLTSPETTSQTQTSGIPLKRRDMHCRGS